MTFLFATRVTCRCRDEEGRPMDEDEIIDEVNTVMFAGHDTTANAITWLLIHLATNTVCKRYPSNYNNSKRIARILVQTTLG